MELLLSLRSKKVLIKAVAQAIPTYSISCFKLPKDLCDHTNSMPRNQKMIVLEEQHYVGHTTVCTYMLNLDDNYHCFTAVTCYYSAGIYFFSCYV
jgi:hypothetical protein